MKHKFTKAELEDHLKEQIGFLERSARDFDKGIVSEAKRLASVIRLLVRDTNQVCSLLKQLGMKDIPFLDLADSTLEGGAVRAIPTRGSSA